MKRTILTAVAVLGAGTMCLMAQPKAKSQAEVEVLKALFGAAQQGNNDLVITKADELLTKFADTQFKEIALTLEAGACEAKGDWAKEEFFLEQVLLVNPKNPDAHVKIAEITVKHTHENDLDKDEKLARAEKSVAEGLELLKTAPKPGPQVTDEQWEGQKRLLRAEGEQVQGLSAMTRKKYDEAIPFLKAAVEDDAQPAYQAQLASAYLHAGKNDEALAVCDKVLADPNLHPAIKSYVQAIKTDATKAKSAGK